MSVRIYSENPYFIMAVDKNVMEMNKLRTYEKGFPLILLLNYNSCIDSTDVRAVLQ